MKIWEPKPPGTLWATPGLLRDSFTFVDNEKLIDTVRIPNLKNTFIANSNAFIYAQHNN